MNGFESVEIMPFNRVLDRSSFSCGNSDLDLWLQNQAGQQERSGNTRTFLALHPDIDGVVGYYSTTTYRLDLDDASRALGAGKRRYPVPAVLLARLAVDKRLAGRGVGRQLLAHALTGFGEASEHVGFEVVVVDAIDDDAVTSYARYGFARFADHSRSLFMTTKVLRATLEQKQRTCEVRTRGVQWPSRLRGAMP